MKPYVMSKYTNMQELKNDVMVATDITDIERMAIIFNTLSYDQKESIKHIDNQFYYTILSVLDEFHRNNIIELKDKKNN